jgi:hypothetical protein
MRGRLAKNRLIVEAAELRLFDGVALAAATPPGRRPSAGISAGASWA